MEDLVYDGFVALMGEGAAAPRRTRAWATPEWCAGECPGCARQLRLLLVPTLDVIKCIYCQTASYACLSQTARTTENNKNHDDTILPVEPPQPPSLTLRFSGTGRGSWKVQGGRGSGGGGRGRGRSHHAIIPGSTGLPAPRPTGGRGRGSTQ